MLQITDFLLIIKIMLIIKITEIDFKMYKIQNKMTEIDQNVKNSE